MYETPDMICEGDRERCAFHEVQAGSPLGLPDMDDFDLLFEE